MGKQTARQPEPQLAVSPAGRTPSDAAVRALARLLLQVAERQRDAERAAELEQVGK